MQDLPEGALFHTQMGEGPRSILALHCTLAHSGAWKGLLRAFEGAVTVHAFDFPNHGRSADWDPAFGDYHDVSVAGALAALDKAGGPLDVVGHSFGATVALRVAIARPDRVRSLVLIEPVLFCVAAQDAPAFLADHDQMLRPFADAYAAGEVERATRLFNEIWSDGLTPRWQDLPQKTRDAMVRAIHAVPAASPALFDDRPGVLAPGVLDKVTMPVCLLRGSRTHPVIGAINAGLARRLPDARNHVIEGAGHMVPITHPVETVAILRQCFDRVAG